jgi:hypothetical protein
VHFSFDLIASVAIVAFFVVLCIIALWNPSKLHPHYGQFQEDFSFDSQCQQQKTTGKQATKNKKIKLIGDKCYWNQP